VTKIQDIFDQQEMVEMSSQGRTVVEEQYSFEAAVDRYRTLLSLCG